MTDEQKAAYVAGADQAVEDARVAHAKAVEVQAPPSEVWQAHQAVRAAVEHSHECRLQVYGVVCPRCDGAMTLPGKMPWDSHDCPVCDGWGKVLPEVAAEFWRRNGFGSADAAAMAQQGVTLRTVDDYQPKGDA